MYVVIKKYTEDPFHVSLGDKELEQTLLAQFEIGGSESVKMNCHKNYVFHVTPIIWFPLHNP
jgi:hypothetical protein